MPPAAKTKTKTSKAKAIVTSTGDPVSDFHQRLQALGYITSDRALVAQCYALEQFARMTTKAVPAMLLQGPPGTGKTFLGETMARLWDASAMLIFQFTPGVTKEDLMFDLDIANIAAAQAGRWEGTFDAEHAVRPGIFARALTASLKGRVVLLLDELDKASEKVDAFLLDYLQNCRMDAGPLGQLTGNPKNLLVFITMNNQRLISEPLMRRCQRIALGWPLPAVEAPMVTKLAISQLQQLGRPPKTHTLTALAEILVQLANEVRKHGRQLKKVPSSPELASALIQTAVLPERDWGPAVYNWLLAYEADQSLAQSLVKRSAEQIGRLLTDKAATLRHEFEARKAKPGVIPPNTALGGAATSGYTATRLPSGLGPYYYEVVGGETQEMLIEWLNDGVIIRRMPRPIAAGIRMLMLENGVSYQELYIGNIDETPCYDGWRADLVANYGEALERAVPYVYPVR